MSRLAKSFRDLDVYQTARQLQQDLFELSKSFPKEERYSLTDQIRRSSRSIGANIAEAWQKRRYQAHFESKLSDADAEQAEVQHWIDSATECGYLDIHDGDRLLATCHDIGRMLGKMMSMSASWCTAKRPSSDS